MQVKYSQVLQTFCTGCGFQNPYLFVNPPLEILQFINIFPMRCLEQDSTLKIHQTKVSSGGKTRNIVYLYFNTFNYLITFLHELHAYFPSRDTDFQIIQTISFFKTGRQRRMVGKGMTMGQDDYITALALPCTT